MIMDRVSGFKVPVSRSAEEALTLLKSKIAVREKISAAPGNSKIRLIYRISSIAALLLLFFCVWQILVKPGEEKLIAERGSQKEITMPDGSRVRLNADSKITWSGKQFNNDRHVSLTGEAFFEVSEGKPFTISTKNGNIKVPGTSFNVYARDNSFKVSCFTGQINVSAGDKSVIISQGESAELSADSLKNFSDNYLSRTNSWIVGEFFYENTCLINVFEEIERQFNVKYDADGLENEFFTGSFTNKDLKSALDIVCIPMGLNYEIGKNRHILITKIKQ
jgi:ferric-dicitrate binding protein FerR (iron transport regulator)